MKSSDNCRYCSTFIGSGYYTIFISKTTKDPSSTPEAEII